MKLSFDPTNIKYVEKIERRLGKTEFVDFFTPPKEGDICIMGTYSRTWRNIPRREILKGRGVEVFGRIDTPTAHARDYLTQCYNRRPARKEQRDILRNKHMPLFSYPCIIRDAIYLDVRAAWFSIVHLVGWDCEYNPGRWLGRGSPPDDFPLQENKVARSALVTIGRSGKLPIWKEGKIVYQSMYNTNENYHIWGVCADVLNAIGLFAIEQGARYVNTDGYIIARAKALPLMEFIQSWGLEARVKYQGAACICGPGAYTIGDHSSLREMKFTRIDCIDREVNVSFLRPRVSKRAFEQARAESAKVIA